MLERPPQDTQDTTLDVAVDVHARNLYVLVADRGGNERLCRRVPHTAAGVAAIATFLRPGDRVVLEATTGTHQLAAQLERTGATVLVADPQETRLVGMRGKKSDYRDCHGLLRHLRAGELATIWRPDPDTRELRQLTRERHAYNQAIVRLKNRIRAFLREEGLPVPERLWSAEGAAWLAAQPLRPAARRLLEREWGLLQVNLAYKEAQKQELVERALASEAAQRLLQLPGFGPDTAMMFLGEVGDARRFPNSKALTAYSGLHPRVRQSDERCRVGGISKAGRTQLRWLLIQVAWQHVINQGGEAPHYHRLVARGKEPNVAIVALARRLLVLAYCLLTRPEAYRRLDAVKYEEKLVRLAAKRPERPEPLVSRRAWAAKRCAALLGTTAPPNPPPASAGGAAARVPTGTGRRGRGSAGRRASVTAAPPSGVAPPR
jgi:transposase